MSDDFILTSKVSKEDFKRYFTDCPKVAWIYYNLDNFKKALALKNEKKFSFHIKNELEEAEDFNTAEGFDPFALYEHLLKGENLSEEELVQREILIQQFENIDGFDINLVEAETIADGKMVGDEARAYFRLLLNDENKKNNTNFESYSFEELPFYDALTKTKAVMQNADKYKYLFEPTFELFNSKLRVKCDVLINHGNNKVEIIEVKASSKHKDNHFFDLMYQWYVLTTLGFDVIKVSLCTLNNRYFRQLGIIDEESFDFSADFEAIDFEKEINQPFLQKDFDVPFEKIPDDVDVKKLFVVSDRYIHSTRNEPCFVDFFKNIDDTYNLKLLFQKIALVLTNEQTLSNNECVKYGFDYVNENLKMDSKYCEKVVPYYDETKYNLFQLSRFKSKAIGIYYEQDVVYMQDACEKLLHDNFVNEKNKPVFNEDQKRVIKISSDFEKTGKKDYSKIINQEKLPLIIDLLKDYYQYPVYMYDFETSMWAVPKYNKSKSYQQIPFQYSIHVILDNNYDFLKPEDTMKHYSFIAEQQYDPRPAFLKKFIKDCFAHGPGVYVAYNKSFERMVLKNLIQMYPEFKAPLKWIYQNTIDLRDFFALSKNHWLIYDPTFKGSSSIKYTQPGLDASLSYKDLRINKGDKASVTFKKYADKKITQATWDEIIKSDMLKYCDRDTLAMVVVLQSIVKMLKIVDPTFESKIFKLLEGEKNV